MAERAERANRRPFERRRFLRESLRGGLPAFVGWLAGRARSLAALGSASPSLPKIPLPAAPPTSPPAAAARELDEHHRRFARDNPHGSDPDWS